MVNLYRIAGLRIVELSRFPGERLGYYTCLGMEVEYEHFRFEITETRLGF